MNVGTYLTKLLSQYGVERVFGIPGVHTLELYRGLTATGIQHTTPRHEQGAGFMADGYARVSGKPGVCFIISGPGMTNIITAMGQAWSESIPMLVISTVNSHGRMGSGEGWLHELPDQQSLVSGVCAFSHTVHCANEIYGVLARAFAVFDSSRPRPVHIEIPINILNGPAPAKTPSRAITRLLPPVGHPSLITKAAALLESAATPIILAGGGSVRAKENIQVLAETLDAPVVMTVNARGIVNSQHPLAVPASASLPEVRDLIDSADVVLAIGTEFGSTDYDFNEDGLFAIPGQLIRIDIDPEQLMRTQIPDIAINGDAQESTNALLESIKSSATNLTGKDRAGSCLENLRNIATHREQQYRKLVSVIDKTLNNPIIVGDSTQIIYATNAFYGSNEPRQYFNSAMGFGTLGYALPAAMGASLAAPENTVVAISGDGGLQFCVGEMSSAMELKNNLVLLVHENGGYQEIGNFMHANDISPIGVDLTLPKLTVLAESYGWNTIQVSHLDEFKNALDNSASSTRPSIILLQDSFFD